MRLSRILSFLLLAFLAFPSFGQPVDAVRAEQAARSFFQNDRSSSRRNIRLNKVEYTPSIETKSDAPSFYVFEKVGGGFVIIAGDQRCRPVLGYSFTNSFFEPGSMPEGAREWFADLEDEVAFVRSGGGYPSVQAKAAWSALETSTKAGGSVYASAVKHETPTWGQGAPFNRLAPTVDGTKTVAGCVPLAFSMLCRFYTYPAKGEGSLPGYTFTSDKNTSVPVEGYELGYPYEWDKIKMDYTEFTEEEADAVARLVYDCGVMCQVSFGPSTSGNISVIAGKSIEFFGFDGGARHLRRGFFTDEVWTEMLKEEIVSHPVMYSARREGDYGHAFLLDGYDKNDNFSINWGWSGKGNGYFPLSSFASSPDRAYIYKHAAIFGLKPQAGGKGENYLYLTAGKASSGNEYNGLTPLTDNIVPRQDFKMKVGGVANGGLESFDAYFVVGLADADGNLKDLASGSQYFDYTKPNSWRGYSEISCFIPVYPREGDKLMLFYCTSEEITMDVVPWKKVVWDSTTDLVGEIPVYDRQTLTEVTSISYNKSTGLMTIETKDGIDWKLEGSADAATAVNYGGTTFVIDASKLSKGDYTLKFNRDKEKYELKLKMGLK